MSNRLDREGIFMARPVSWNIRTFDGSDAVAVNIEFLILGQLNLDGGWDDWRGYDEHTCWGMFFVTKKTGEVNVTTVEQLARSMGWTGNLHLVAGGPPPSTPVQINVKADEYKGKTTYKATWVNPKDYSPSPSGAAPEEVDKLQTRFGSLLRAAAAAAAKEHVADPVAPADAENGSFKEPEFTPPASSDPADDLPF